jgi:hypothetical protein
MFLSREISRKIKERFARKTPNTAMKWAKKLLKTEMTFFQSEAENFLFDVAKRFSQFSRRKLNWQEREK